MEPTAFNSIIEKLEVWEYGPGQTIINEGDDGNEVFFVFKGLVEFSSQNIVLGSKGEGGYFGEIAMFAECQRTCSVIARHPSQLLVLKRRDFQQLMKTYKALFSDAVKTTFDRYAKEEVLQGEKRRPSKCIKRKPGRVSIANLSITSAVRKKNTMSGTQLLKLEEKSCKGDEKRKVQPLPVDRDNSSGSRRKSSILRSGKVQNGFVRTRKTSTFNSSHAINHLNYSFARRHSSVYLQTADWLFMARIHTQRLLFNAMNARQGKLMHA